MGRWGVKLFLIKDVTIPTVTTTTVTIVTITTVTIEFCDFYKSLVTKV